jgi:glycosyltransferase involved in cell wall biosynthesis
MSPPRVSVVIPAYNAEQYLAEAIESVLAQTLPCSELIVVDDGSVDATADVARSFPSVSLVSMPHQGVSAARNAGVARSSGDWLAFLDADDTWLPGKLARQLELAREVPDAGIVMAHQGYLFEGPVPAWFRGPTDGGSEPGFQPSNWLVTRATWDRVGRFDETLTHSEDTDWLARAHDCGVRTCTVPETLVVHRIHTANASGMAVEVRAGVLTALRASVLRKREARNA